MEHLSRSVSDFRQKEGQVLDVIKYTKEMQIAIDAMTSFETNFKDRTRGLDNFFNVF